ncbi:MAG TPA: cupin-like domain-containing protein [Chitinophagaceae bacterium]
MEFFRRYFNFFGEQLNHELYEMALQKNEAFTISKTSYNHRYPEWRKSTVIYHDQFEFFRQKIVNEVKARLPEVLEALSVKKFEIETFEVQLTSHNDGEYYKWHTDNGSPDTSNRIITFVYYFHSLPKMFSGGQLVIYNKEESFIIEPENDSIVFFHSGRKHEVKPVVCPTRLFEHGRFTLNGWVRFKSNAYLKGNGMQSQNFSNLLASNIFAGMNGTTNQKPDARKPLPVKEKIPSQSLEEKIEKLESLLDYYSDLYRQSGESGKIAVESNISGGDFFRKYYFLNRPVLIKGMMANWPAMSKWSLSYLAENFGHIPIEVTANRDRNADYEKNFRNTLSTCTLSEFIQKIMGEGETNDFYLVARNYFFANPAFEPLKDDLRPPPDIIDHSFQSRGSIKLWLGPKGTVTPLHHDKHNILFTQISGRKHFRMIPSFELNKVYNTGRYYSEVDIENPDGIKFPKFLQTSIADVIVNPGDMLLIPAGWWHWVKSLDISISVTFSSFMLPEGNTEWRCL